MTAYNRQKYIAQAIESVLASTYSNLELIISDDCSTDSTVEIAREYEVNDSKIKVFANNENLGDYYNRNKAASYAKGKYIKYLDSDDIMYPHCLQVMVSAMEKFPEAGFGLSAMAQEDRPYPVCISQHDAYKEHFNGFGHFNRAPGSAIIKRDAFIKVGGFSGNRMIGDNELWFALARIFKLVKMQRDLVWDRVHKEQERQSEYAKQYDTLLRKVLKDALSHPECPFSNEEKKQALQQLQLRKFKNLFQ